MTTRLFPPTSARHSKRAQACRWPHTILLVEDEPFVREATRGILESAGFEVLTAEDATAALKIYDASTRAIDLVMTDLILPGRSGQLLRADLLQRSPNLSVLVTSGYRSAESSANDPQSHTYFLAKPYSRHDLVAKIEEMFMLPLKVLPLRPSRRQSELSHVAPTSRRLS